MSTDGQEICKEKQFGCHDENSLPKKAPCSTLNLDESTSGTECDDLTHSDIRRTANYMHFCDVSTAEFTKMHNRLTDEILERYYVQCDEKKLNAGKITSSEEQPLDFSHKSKSSEQARKIGVNNSIVSLRSQEHGANNSQRTDDSSVIVVPCLTDRFHPYRQPGVVFHTSGSANISLDENRGEKRGWMSKMSLQRKDGEPSSLQGVLREQRQLCYSHKYGREVHSNHSIYRNSNFDRTDSHSGRKSPHTTPNGHPGNDTDCSTGYIDWKDKIVKKRLKSPYWSGGEFHTEHSVDGSSSFERDENHSESKSPPSEHHSAERNESQHKTSNGHPDSGAGCSTRKNDGFLVQDILAQPTITEEHAQTAHQLNDSANQRRMNRQLTASTFCKEGNLAMFNSSSQSVPLAPSRFPVGASDRSHDSSGMFNPLQAVLPSSAFTKHLHNNFAQHGSRYTDYPYPQLFNPVQMYPYQPAFPVSPDQQGPKKQRPFKSADPSALLRQHNDSLESLGASTSSKFSVSAAANSPPQSLSPESLSMNNSSPGNSNESLLQEANEPNRKKIRRVPPEEKDEKYKEKRRKNNLAAKKSRDERRKKEDLLAIACERLKEVNHQLTTANKILNSTLRDKDLCIDMLKVCLITFREKCDEHMREMFEESFNFFLPQPLHPQP